MQVLLCKPDYYGLEYEINPWMKVKNQPNQGVALSQWQSLYDNIAKVADVSLIPQVKGLPDMVFTANAGIVRGKKTVISKFRHPQRQGEELYFEKWFLDHSFEVLKTTNVFEGEGDALFVGDKLCIGHPQRSDIGSHEELAKLLDVETFSLELVDDRFYHLDTCFFPLNDKVVFYAPEAFSEKTIEMIERNFYAIQVPAEEAALFSCNSIVLGNTVITPEGGNTIEFHATSRGYEVIKIPVTEFIKAGGACKCLTLITSR